METDDHTEPLRDNIDDQDPGNTSSFNITRRSFVVPEILLEEKPQENEETETTVTYHVADNGTTRNKLKLADSIGYTYTVKSKQEAATNAFKPEAQIVNDAMVSHSDHTAPAGSRPNVHNLQRSTNRLCEKSRPKDPTDLNFEVQYRQHDGVYKFVRKLMALCFLPHEYILPTFQRLKDQLDQESPKLHQLVNYISRT
ncbi:unnamed protein product [Mytilus coruscus]|uniref:Uncharacterized protein n=1 Tax=Mytilus coruscus TaxID=42192 RepID=A0A6J8E989_MYTCO|nr:unnamed protein product [Mytilus coruscus]